ncbi:SDR family NAD(P)-dependent oxidoreductase [Pseudomonas sp. UM16]|uniref:SDR family NAD(P)-dependent oxidoreductase n=1 Tax=Pseudomonas sp. UM16 TaxID=3158962 RepID=UPI00398FEE6D
MSSSIARRFWVSGASSGLGLTLVEQLLEQGAQVAASGKRCEALRSLTEQYPQRLLLLDGNLTEPFTAQQAAKQIADRWGALECLIINAGTCDYLALGTPAPAMFESIINSNLSASRHCLENALPLLRHGRSPQVVGIFSRYSSLQLGDPSQPLTSDNSVIQLLNGQRTALTTQGIDLTIIAPKSLNHPQTPVPVALQQWTARSAAQAILERLPERPANLVLEALQQNNLWPLPK